MTVHCLIYIHSCSLSWFNLAAGNSVLDSPLLTPPLFPQLDGDEKMDKKGNSWVGIKTI